MKKICLCCLALICLTNLFAQETVNYKEKMPYKTWVKMAPKLNDEFFKMCIRDSYYSLHEWMGNHALWLAFIVYLSLRGIVQAVLSRKILYQS